MGQWDEFLSSGSDSLPGPWELMSGSDIAVAVTHGLFCDSMSEDHSHGLKLPLDGQC